MASWADDSRAVAFGSAGVFTGAAGRGVSRARRRGRFGFRLSRRLLRSLSLGLGNLLPRGRLRLYRGVLVGRSVLEGDADNRYYGRHRSPNNQ